MAFDALRSTFKRSAPAPDQGAPSTFQSGAPAVAAPSFGSGTPSFAAASSYADPGAAPSSYAADQYSPVFADPVAAGGTDAESKPCPSCGRTLPKRSFRCDGCGERFVLEVPAKRAGMLAGGGAVAGILLTLLLVNVFAPAKPAETAAAADGATGSVGSSRATPALDLPIGAIASLKGTTQINGRLATDGAGLAKQLDGKSFNTTEVVKILRRMAIDTRAGAGMTGPMAGWSAAAGQQAALAKFYAELGDRIDAGLSASVNSAGSYKKAAKAVLATLHDIVRLDEDARTLAGLAGVQLVPVKIPAALR